MRRLLTICVVIGLIAAISCPLEATVIVLNFDDITSQVTDDVVIPDGYGGLNWDKFGVNRRPLRCWPTECLGHIARK